MSDLRDARLRRALESAPDADLVPGRRTRQAVLAAARQALAPEPRTVWWRRLWQGLGERGRPWNAAFATVAIATLITVLWHEREAPGSRPDAMAPGAPAPAAPSQPASATGVPAPATPVSRRPAMAAAPPATVPARKAKTAVKPQPSSSPAAAAAAAPQRAEEARERRSQAEANAMRDQAAPESELAAAARAPDRAAAPPPAATAPSAPPMSRAAPVGLATRADLAKQADPSAAGDWTHLRISAQGRSVELEREQAPRLAQLLEGLARETRSREPLDAPATIRIELIRAAEPAGVIEVAGSQVRWTPAAGRTSFTARPHEASLASLRDEVSRLLRR